MTLCEIRGIASVTLLEPSKLAQVVMIVTYIWEVPGFYLNWDSDYVDRFLWFSSVPAGECWDDSQK
jgi:hypothetical protein